MEENTNSIIKNVPTKDFTILPNSFLRDKRLSPQAIGIGAIIGSLPEDWSLSKEGLKTFTGIKRTRIDSAFKELQAAGYLYVGDVIHGAGGKFSGQEYIFNAFAHTPVAENQQTAPVAEKPLTVKQQEQIKDIQININNNATASVGADAPVTGKEEVEEQKKPKKQRTQKPFIPPTVEDVMSYALISGLIGDEAEAQREAQNFIDWHTKTEWKYTSGKKKGQPVKNWKGLLQNIVKKKAVKAAAAVAIAKPTLEEVQQEIAKQGLTKVDAKNFCDYYEGKNWETKYHNPINWRAKLPEWEERAYDDDSSSFRCTAPTGATVDTTDPTYMMLKKAAANGRLGASDEFNGLPVDLQKIIGSPAKIRSWSKMQQKELDTALATILTEYRSQQPA